MVLVADVLLSVALEVVGSGVVVRILGQIGVGLRYRVFSFRPLLRGRANAET